MAQSGIQELCSRLLSVRHNFYRIYRYKTSIDYSNFPKLNEKDVEEQFIKGHGPGGSNVNKTTNCVLLKHLPTGIVIKCHEARLLQKNRELAREILLSKLDDFYNGEMSISAQNKRINKLKLAAKQKKQERLREMKKNFNISRNENETC